MYASGLRPFPLHPLPYFFFEYKQYCSLEKILEIQIGKYKMSCNTEITIVNILMYNFPVFFFIAHILIHLSNISSHLSAEH